MENASDIRKYKYLELICSDGPNISEFCEKDFPKEVFEEMKFEKTKEITLSDIGERGWKLNTVLQSVFHGRSKNRFIFEMEV